MVAKLKGKDFITLRDYSREDLETILSLASELKRKYYLGEPHRLLEGKVLGMLFFQSSTRTRIAFESGMSHLGGHAQYYTPEQLHVLHGESWVDTAQILSRYLNGIVIRMSSIPGREDLKYGDTRRIIETMAANASIPIINGLDDKEHPCQVMADIQTIMEKFGPDYKNKKVVLAWCPYPGPISPGIPHSLALAGTKLGMKITYAYPEGFDLDPEYINEGLQLAKQSRGSLEITHNINEAVENADVIYAKSWKLMGKTREEYLKRRESLMDWRITKAHFDIANQGAIFMNAMPIARDNDATNEVIDGPMSAMYDQAENRMHVQKAIMASIM